MIPTALVLTIVALLVSLPSAVLADSITPGSYTATLDVGESVTIDKTVTVTEEPPTDAKVDIFFLTDSTGSMGGLIADVKTNANAILTDTTGLGDVAWGVGEYRDIGDLFEYRTNQDITTNQAAAQAGINAWNALGGGDWEEANLYALEQVADTSTWRSDSTRIVVWFGDAPGHDPSGTAGVTEAQAIAALNEENIIVEALDLADLDGNPDWQDVFPHVEGQASRIAAATGGHYYDYSGGIDEDEVVDAINDAIEEAFEEYGEVKLQSVGNLPGVGVSVSPAAHTGAYDRSAARTFDFDVTFTGLQAGVYNFKINALVDGGIVATEDDKITVNKNGEPIIPEPSTMLLLAVGLFGLGVFGGKKIRKKRS
jgi:hypothetical protein